MTLMFVYSEIKSAKNLIGDHDIINSYRYYTDLESDIVINS